MTEVANLTSFGVMTSYNNFISLLPPIIQNFVSFFLLVLGIVVYSVLVWRFYKFISRKNPLGLDLKKYNKAESPFLTKLLTGGLYFLEYILILPFLIFIVFIVFTLLLMLLSQGANISQILIISATIIAAIRITAYYREALSQEIAKMLPLMFIAIVALNPNTFSQTQYIEGLFNLFNQIPDVIEKIGSYLLFIIFIEVILRLFDFIFSLFNLNEDENVKEGLVDEEESE